MPEHTSEQLLAAFDRCPLHARYWTIFGLVSAVAALDFFDFFSVGFLVAKIAPDWHLTYGQSATILFGGGVGAVVGALVWGALSDKWGRKALIVSGTFICAFGAGAISLIPDGAWLLFAVLRFLVGFGLAGSFAPATTLIVEFTPTRHRTVVAGLFIVAPTVGTMIASLTVANLFTQLGWRGVAALGVIPALLGVLVIFVIPESVRWLAAKGRFAEAQKTVAGLLHLPFIGGAVANDQAHRPADGEPGGALRPAGDLLADPHHLGSSLDGGLRGIPVGTDHRCATAQHANPAGGAILLLCHRGRRHW
jgi:putative MFS transporter